jgi:hypothetical protein
MLGVTGFGLVFTPTFYVVSRSLGERIATLRDRFRSGRDPLSIPAE